MSPNPTPKEEGSRPAEEMKQDELLVNSDLWKTLFRGGYMIGKLTRSLSGAYVSYVHFITCTATKIIRFRVHLLDTVCKLCTNRES